MATTAPPDEFCPDGAAMHERATDSKRRSISGAHRVNGFDQKLYRGFLMSSMNVISSPYGWGRWTMSRSTSTRVICSCTASVGASEKR